jgi:hypothetical protein
MDKQTLSQAATLIAQRLKKSRSAPKITAQHFREMLEDANRLGHSVFLERIQAVLGAAAGPEPGNAEPDALTDKLKALKMKTGLDMKSFLNIVIDEIAKARPHVELVKSKRGLPNFLVYYRNLLDDGVIEKAASTAAQAHSRTHSAPRAA